MCTYTHTTIELNFHSVKNERIRAVRIHMGELQKYSIEPRKQVAEEYLHHLAICMQNFF